MIQPPAQKPHPEDQRRPDSPQAFLEIGALLLGHMMAGAFWQSGQSFAIYGVEIADHLLWGHAIISQQFGPTISSDQTGGVAQGRLEIRLAGLPRADKCHGFR